MSTLTDGEGTMKPQPVVWTRDARRIATVFTSAREGRIHVYSVGQTISFPIPEEENAETIRATIGEVLAGQPVSDTARLLRERFGR